MKIYPFRAKAIFESRSVVLCLVQAHVFSHKWSPKINEVSTKCTKIQQKFPAISTKKNRSNAQKQKGQQEAISGA